MMATVLPFRNDNLLKKSPNRDLLLPAAFAACLIAWLKELLTLGVCEDMIFPPVIFLFGQNPNHEAKCSYTAIHQIKDNLN